MDLFWIAGAILIAVLGFNLLRWMYQKGLYWVRDGRKEYMEEIEDTEPLPRWGHLAVTVGSKVFVWGGEGSTEEDRKFLQFFDMDTKKWWKRITKGSPPEGYVACAYTLIGKVLYVFGGSDGQNYYNDIYWVELDTTATTLEWKMCEVQNPNLAPMKKRSTGMIARKTEDNSVELVVFGGYGAPQKDTLPGSTIHRTSEVHTFNIETGEWNAMDVRKPVPQWDSFTFTKIDDDLAVAIGGVQQGPGSVNYVYCLQMKESATTNDPEWSWVRVATTGETGVPSARRDHATILLGTTQHSAHLFMTGGIDKKWHSLGDAWILNLKREGDKISQGSWLKVAGRHQELVANSPSDSAADNTDPLKPRFSLTANKCESNGSEQSFHLMIFGGIFKYQDPVTKDSKEIVLAETKVLTLACTYTIAISSAKLSVQTPNILS